MKKYFILLIFTIFLTLNSHAGEREWHMNLFDSNGWVRPFHIGGVFCDQKNEIWSEKCQDAMLEDIYGRIWPEVKKVILAFQKAVVKNDYRYLKGKTVIPQEDLHVSIWIRSDPMSYKLVTDHPYLVNEWQIDRAFLNRIPDALREKIKNSKYEDMRLDIWGESMKFDYDCGLHFKLNCDLEITEHNHDRCEYIPKIDFLFLDLQLYQN